MYRYLKKTSFESLRKTHKYLVGWGAGQDEYFKRYNISMYKLDYMIDTKESYIGKIICGMKICSKEILKTLNVSEKICFIIFPNVELEIIEQIQEYMTEFDIIAARLIDCGEQPVSTSYSTANEDLIFYHTLSKLGVTNPYYMDIGVCHPVIRNNTYLLYEKGFTEGVLVEPNLNMNELGQIYRPENTIVKAGASTDKSGSLKYYHHPVSTFCGHNTFDHNLALEQGFGDSYTEVPVYPINQIMKDYCAKVPDLLDIDTEGMDFELLQALDTEQYRIKLICTEAFDREKMTKLMESKGYVHYMETLENTLYLAMEYADKL